MKPTTVTAIALLSFAAGWVIKPSGSSDEATAATPQETTEGKPSKSRTSTGSPLVLERRGTKATREPAPADPARVAAVMEFERNFGNATQRAESARLARMEEALGLSEEQRSTFTVLLENRRDGFRDLNGGGSTPHQALQAAALAEQKFMQDASKLLDGEQYAALEDFKRREQANDVEAKAQRDLADLIGQVDLSEEQRDLALSALRQESDRSLSKRPAGWSLISESFGVLSPSHSATMEEMADVMADPTLGNDPAALQQKIAETQRASSEARMSALSAILTPGQLAQYRSTLDARSTLMEGFTPPAPKPR